MRIDAITLTVTTRPAFSVVWMTLFAWILRKTVTIKIQNGWVQIDDDLLELKLLAALDKSPGRPST